MSETTQAAFTEVLEVVVDLPKFQEGLEQLKAAYLAFVTELGDSASSVIGVGTFVGLQKQMQQFQEDLTTVVASNQTAYEEIVTAVQNASEKIDSIQENLAQKQAARAKKVAEAQVQATASNSNVSLDGLTVENISPAERKAREIATEQEGVVNATIAANAKLSASAQKTAEDIELAIQGAMDQAAVAAEKAADRAVAADKKRADSAKKTAEEIELAIQGAMDQAAVATEKAAKKAEEDDAKKAASAKKLSEEIQIEQQGLLDRYAEQVEKSDAKNAGFFTKFAQGLEGSIVHLTRFVLVWNVLLAAIDAVTAAVEAPFKAVAEGVSYLTDTEKAADELVGVLQANVKFSDDLAKNFKASQDASVEIVKSFQAISAQTGIKEGTLTNVFKALTESGAVAGVQNMQELVTLTQSFAMAFQAAGVSAQGAERIVGEIHTAMTGNLADGTSKWLEILHLSNNEWVQIRDAGLQHGDLLSRLAPILKPYLDAANQAKLHAAALVEQWTILRKQIEGTAVAPVFEKLVGYLASLNQWLTENKDLLAGWLRLFADGLLEIVSVFADLANATGLTDLLIGAFQALTLIVTGLKDVLVTTLQGIVLFFRVAKDGITGDLDGISKSFDEFQKKQADMTANEERLWDLIQGRAASNPSSDVLSRSVGSKTPPPTPISQLSVIPKEFDAQKQKFLADLEDIRERYKEHIDQINELVASRQKSKTDAAKEIADLVGAEAQEVYDREQSFLDAVASLRSKILSDSAPADKRNAALTEFDSRIQGIETQVQKQVQQQGNLVVAARKAANAEEAAIQEAHFKNLIAMRDDEVKHELALIKEAQAEGLLTDQQVLEANVIAEKQAHDNRIALIDDELSKVAQGTKEYASLIDQRKRADQDYQQQQELDSRRRQLLREEEAQKLQEFYDQLRALSITDSEEQYRVGASLLNNPTLSNALGDPLEVRSKEIDALILEKSHLLEVAKAKNDESDSTRRLTLELQQLHNERLKVLGEQLGNIAATNSNPAIRRLLQANQIEAAQGDLQDNLKTAQRLGLDSEVAEIQKALKQLDDLLTQAAPDLGTALRGLADQILGFDFIRAWGEATDAVSKFSVAANGVAGLLGTITQAIQTYQRGAAQGGTLGGIGAVVGQYSEALSAIPVVGQFAPAIAGVLSFVGGLFTSAAKRIAEDVKKSFQSTLDNYQNGNATLQATISQIEQERTQAIVQLSGKKGGKDQLDQLLPELDKELNSLKQQQKQITDNFDQSLYALQLHSDTLSQISKQWADINKQVKDYLGAGGDTNKATQFLSLQLEQIKEQASQQLSQGEQQAIQDAIQLNSLLQQRNKLQSDFEKQQFDLINADSLERRQAGSVTRGQQLATLRAQYEQDLANLNEQIGLTQQKVDRETQVFNLATNIEALHRRDDELTLQALDLQIQKYKDLQSIIASISVGSNGVYYGSGGVFGSGGTVQVNVTVNSTPGASPSDLGQQIGGSVANELSRRFRMVPQ